MYQSMAQPLLVHRAESMLTHQAETHRYWPGQEDTVLPVLSSAYSDTEIYQVLHVPQTEPVTYKVRVPGAWALPRRLAAALAAARHWMAGGRRPVASLQTGHPRGHV